MKNLWFKRRRYGYGWVPVTWQGFAVIVGYIGLILLASFALLGDAPQNQFSAEAGIYYIALILLTVTLFRICLAKGPKPKWRWGKKDSDDPSQDF